jgi:hypothetical protein
MIVVTVDSSEENFIQSIRVLAGFIEVRADVVIYRIALLSSFTDAFQELILKR